MGIETPIGLIHSALRAVNASVKSLVERPRFGKIFRYDCGMSGCSYDMLHRRYL